MDWYLLSFTMVVLGIAIWTDVKAGIIPDWLNYGAIITALSYRLWQGDIADYLLGAGFMFVTLSILALVIKDGIGGGDLKLFIFLGLIVGYPLVGIMAFITFILAVVYSFVVKQKGVILAPFITFGFVLVIVFQMLFKSP